MDAPARVRAAERQARCIASGRTGSPEGAGWSAFFPPEAERFLRRPVGVAEDHAVGRRLEAAYLPRRHDENVMRREIETLAPDIGAAPPFDHAVHRAVGAAMPAPGEPSGQPLHENRQARERILAGVAMGIAQLPAVTRMRITALREALQICAGAFIGE